MSSQPSRNPLEGLNCPRCDSTDTKFCYYNNHSTSQPRYFCKSCKRYWTEGGTLRNVPVGGGLRKNKKRQQQNSFDVGIGSKHRRSAYTVSKAECTEAAGDGGLSFLQNHNSGSNIGMDTSSATSAFGYAVNGLPCLQQASLQNRCQKMHEYRDFPSFLGSYRAIQSDMGFCSDNLMPATSSDQAQSSSGETGSNCFRWQNIVLNQYSMSTCQSSEKDNEEQEDWEPYSAVGAYQSVSNGQHVLGEVDSDDAFSNIVSVRYPFDWQEVTECLFGGMEDFLYYIIPGGADSLSDFGAGLS